MKNQYLKLLVLGILALVMASVPAFAKNSISIALSQATVVNGTSVAAGDYTVKWEQHSPEATVTLVRGNDVVASSPAKVVERDTKYAATAVVTDTHADGTKTLLKIEIGGTRQALVFGE
ncbi:MAG: hypothetical protein PHX83_08905 [Acidobacteriia bacterium]|nr:hypothetical protein [Terriglobia bacterium]